MDTPINVHREEGKNLEFALLIFSAKNIVPQEKIILSSVPLFF